MKKKTYKLIETISKSIIEVFPYLTAKEHSEVMENFIYGSLMKNLKLSEDSVKAPKYNTSMPKYTFSKPKYTFSNKYHYTPSGSSFYDPPKKPKKKEPWKIDGEHEDIFLKNAIEDQDYHNSEDSRKYRQKTKELTKRIEDEYERDRRIKEKQAELYKLRNGQNDNAQNDDQLEVNKPELLNSVQKKVAMISALIGIPIASAVILYKKYGPSIVEKLQKSAPPSRLEKAKRKFKELMKKIKLAESRRLYTKNKKSKIKEGLSNSPLNPTYETDGIFNYPYGKKDTNVEEFIKANPATLSLAAALVAVTGWSLIKCVKFIIKKGEDAAKLLVNLGKNSDKKNLLKKAMDKYVNN